MKQVRLALLCLVCASSSAPTSADSTDEYDRWARSIRGSGSYQEGLRKVRDLVDKAYDVGALKGAAHWDHIHEYFLSLARAKGCERGMPYADGPVKACLSVSGKEPSVKGSDYREGVSEVSAIAAKTLYPDLVRPMLKNLYDYGYVQGMKHGLRAHNDDIRISQTYYRSCMVRASNDEGERACAEGSKSWSAALVERWRKRLETQGLPARTAP